MRLAPAVRALQRIPDQVPGECWLWPGSLNNQGYGMISVPDQSPKLVHRVLYEHAFGPIPSGLVLDHLCRTPACVNPAHLEAVTFRENVIRGMSPGGIASRTGLCRRGHDEWHYRPNGHRYCRACRRLTRPSRTFRG